MKKNKTLVTIILSLSLFNTSVMAREFRFIDGTVVHGEIYDVKNLNGYGPDERGIIINIPQFNRIYMHHYPYREGNQGFKWVKELIDDGQYTNYRFRKVPTTDRLVTYAPPLGLSDLNPPPLPQCVPSRIPFIHFDKKTLRSLAANELAAGNGPWNERARNSVSKALVWKPSHPSHFNTPQLSAKWQGLVEKEYRNKWNVIYYGLWLERRRR